jgi:asparagine synthase (glutamine-hydrolysing)
MCGIAGFVLTGNEVPASACDIIRRMTDRMRLRGPDAEGAWTGQGVALGHRRLAILDLDVRSNQPMVSADGNYSIVFNGEIYNFRELRRSLEAEGVAFRTASDTEILLALFAREGEHMLPKLRGMFAFAVWNARSHELFLARDPFGIKPLYYSHIENGLIFASQVKALLASRLVSTTCENAGVAGFYLWGNVPEPWTLYRDVFALPAGHWMRVRDGRPGTPVCWNDIRESWREKRNGQPTQELQERVRQAVTDSVRAHLVSDVPVSVFLSGGIDSGAIAGLTSELGAKVECITIAFDEFSSLHEDEVPGATAIAEHYGLPHYSRRVSYDEFEEDTPRILDAMDQPSIDGVNTWFASKAAAERGYKVVLSGVGGDELFFGYSHMMRIPNHVALGKAIAAIPGVRSLMKPALGYLAKGHTHPKINALPEFMGSLEGMYFLRRCLFLPEDLPALMGLEEAQEGLARLGGSPPGMTKADDIKGAPAICMLDSTFYLRNQLLRDSDWASMQHSLELRTPLVDSALLRTLEPYLMGFADGVGKKLLASSPARPLPQDIVNRPKSGFGLPMREWLNKATNQGKWSALPLLASSRTPWARRWARTVMLGG